MKKHPLSKFTLLYVEDDQAIRDELVDLFKRMFLDVFIAKDGEEGYNSFLSNSPDMILTDIRMPKMDGLAMIQKIRVISSDVPVVVSSAFSESKYFLDSIKMGVTGYLLKPIDLRELLNTLENIAEGLLTKELFYESEQILSQYKDVVDQSAIVSKADKNGIITYVNDAFIEISGYSREELIGQKHNKVRHPDMESSVFADLWKKILSKKKWNGIVKNRAKDGSSYWVDSTIIPILDIKGSIVEFISIRKDITHLEIQKQNLEVLLQSSAQSLDEKIAFINEYEKALKISTLFCRTTKDGVISMTSEAFDKLLGYKEGALDGLEYSVLLKPINVASVHKSIKKAIEDGSSWQGLVEHTTKDGELRFLESSFIPIIDAYGEILEVLCFYVDLSESVELNKEIVATQREVISTMGAIGETRSKETGEHVKRVAEYSKLLALKVGLSLEEAEELKMASPMHDIGKVGIPDAILNKPGKLDAAEFEIMKTHASLGYEMLRHSNQKLLRSAAIVANEHHEKWDGSGYPRGISKDAIHIFGRITAIADVFDALGHDRVYKKAWPLEEILQLLKDGRATHFDPNLVDIFMDNLDEFLSIKRAFDNAVKAENE